MLENYLNKVTCCDCLEGMKNLPDGCIDLVVTSPPYDNLRDYKGIKWNETIWQNIIKELFRIIKPGGVVVWVVNDAVIDGSETGTSFKQALYFMQTGFKLHDTMYYEKENFAKPDKTRYWQHMEYMFVFSNGKPKTIHLIRDRKNKHKGSLRTERAVREVDGQLTPRASFTVNEYGKRSNVWRYSIGGICTNKDKFSYKHPAMFPDKLAYDHIISWSNEGGIICDPFIGSGTVAVAAIETGRQYIGMELSEEYCDIAEKRIEKAMLQRQLF